MVARTIVMSPAAWAWTRASTWPKSATARRTMTVSEPPSPSTTLPVDLDDPCVHGDELA